MHRRTWKIVFKTFLVSALILGIPLMLLTPSAIWEYYRSQLEQSVEILGEQIFADENQFLIPQEENQSEKDSALTSSEAKSGSALTHTFNHAHFQAQAEKMRTKISHLYEGEVYLEIRQNVYDTSVENPMKRSENGVAISRYQIALGSDNPPIPLSVQVILPNTTFIVRLSGWSAVHAIGSAIFLEVISLGFIFAFAHNIAARASRKISAPLIYLAALAEQVGDGAVQARIAASGIEEIDLVTAELTRSGERVAGRIAKERQFAADATHQLRTPLAALSMRIEEIEYLSNNPEVAAECEACLEQVERMSAVMDDLKHRSARNAKENTQVIDVEAIFAQQRKEWEPQFRKQGREIIFENQITDCFPLATPGSFSQAIATLIENSLKYGLGTVKVQTRKGITAKSIFVEVSDEGAGIDEELAPEIFHRGVSGHGSTGIGLALARDLVEADGGRLELTQRKPPVFTISLSALPESMSPDRIMPKGAIISFGRRKQRF